MRVKTKTRKSCRIRKIPCSWCSGFIWDRVSEKETKTLRRFCSKTCRLLYKKSRWKGEERFCKKCSNPFWAKASYIRKSSSGGPHFCSRKCCGHAPKKKTMTTDGYWQIKTPHGHKKEHRWIMEKFLKRSLSKNELVHHINHNKLDNRIENLMIVSREEHPHLHNKLVSKVFVKLG